MRLICLLLACALAFAQDDPRLSAHRRPGPHRRRGDRADGPIFTGLTKDDFRVLDERKEQPILHFSADEEPLDLILLFDVSGSMRAVVEKVAAAAREAFTNCARATASPSWSSIADSRVVSPFTEISTLSSGPSTKTFLTALWRRHPHSVRRRRRCPALPAEKKTERRRAVLIITDNIGRVPGGRSPWSGISGRPTPSSAA